MKYKIKRTVKKYYALVIVLCIALLGTYLLKLSFAANNLVVDQASVGGKCSDSLGAGQVTSTQPLCTINKAVELAGAGDSITVRKGTYSGLAVNRLFDALVTIKAYAGEKPELAGFTVSTTGGRVRLEGFKITDASRIDGSYVEFINNELTPFGLGLYGNNNLVQGNNIHDMQMRYNPDPKAVRCHGFWRINTATGYNDAGEIEGSTAGDGIYDVPLAPTTSAPYGYTNGKIATGAESPWCGYLIRAGGINNTIRGNTLDRGLADGIQLFRANIDEKTMKPVAGASYIIENNKIMNVDAISDTYVYDPLEHPDGVQVIGMNDSVTIRNNYFKNTRGILPMSANSGDKEEWPNNLRIENNIFDADRALTHGNTCIDITAGIKIEVFNNLCWGTVGNKGIAARGGANDGASTVMKAAYGDLPYKSSVTIKNNISKNIVINGDAPVTEDYNLTPSMVLTRTTNLTRGGHTKTGSPTFVANDPYYRLAAGSLGIDAGTTDGAPATDREGRARFDAADVSNTGGGTINYLDIGPSEFAADTPPPPVPPPPATTPPSNLVTLRAEAYSRKTIYHSPETPGFSAWTGAWIMPDGALMTAFSVATDPNNVVPAGQTTTDFSRLDQSLKYYRSTDSGSNWKLWRDDRFKAPGSTAYTPQATIGLKDGTVLRRVNGDDLRNDSNVVHTAFLQKLAAGSNSWSPAQVLWDPSQYMYQFSRIRYLRDGRLIATGQLWQVPADPEPNKVTAKSKRVLLMTSADEGKTWKESLTIPSGTNLYPDEWDTAELPNGNLLAVFRTFKLNADGSFALDTNGKKILIRRQALLQKNNSSWTLTNLKDAPFPHSGHPELLATKEGPILYIATTGVAYTSDGGNTWNDLKFSNPATTYTSKYYPRSVQDSDGTIYVFAHVGFDDPYGKNDQSIVMDKFRLVVDSPPTAPPPPPPATDTTPPSMPTGVKAVAKSDTSVELSWTASSDNAGVDSYKVYRNNAFLTSTAGTSFTDNTVTGGTAYSYTVIAVDAAANRSQTSAAATVTTPEPVDVTPPSMPTGLSAIAVSPAKVNLSWNASTDNKGATSYKVYRNDVYLAATADTSYSDSGVSGGQTYKYTVIATDSAGNLSPPSAAVSVVPPLPSDTIAPTIPQNVSSSNLGTDSVTLEWYASSDTGGSGMGGYHVYRNNSLVATVTEPTYTDKSLTPNTRYNYTIDAFDKANNLSSKSAEYAVTTLKPADTTPPSVPANLRTTSVTTSSAALVWDPSADSDSGVASYKVYRNGTLIGSPSAANFTDTGLKPSTAYTYTVAALDKSNNISAASSGLQVTTATSADTTPPSVPANLRATSVKANAVSLSWDAATDSGGSGLAGYHIYRDGTMIASTADTTYTDSGVNKSTAYNYYITAYDNANNTSGATAGLKINTPVPKSGDCNGDNKVNGVDLSLILSNYGAATTKADANGDGKVNGVDLSIVLSNYGQ